MDNGLNYNNAWDYSTPILADKMMSILSWNTQGASQGEKLKALGDYLDKNTDIKICVLQEFGNPYQVLESLSIPRINYTEETLLKKIKINEKRNYVNNFYEKGDEEFKDYGLIKEEKKFQDMSIAQWTTKGSNVYFIIIYGDYKGNNSKNDAIIVHNSLIKPEQMQHSSFYRPTLDRGFLGLKFRTNTGKTVAIGTFHANAGSDGTRYRDVQKLFESFITDASNEVTFIVGGDYNLGSKVLQSIGLLLKNSVDKKIKKQAIRSIPKTYEDFLPHNLSFSFNSLDKFTVPEPKKSLFPKYGEDDDNEFAFNSINSTMTPHKHALNKSSSNFINLHTELNLTRVADKKTRGL